MLTPVNVLKYNFWLEEQIPKPVFIAAGELVAQIDSDWTVCCGS